MLSLYHYWFTVTVPVPLIVLLYLDVALTVSVAAFSSFAICKIFDPGIKDVYWLVAPSTSKSSICGVYWLVPLANAVISTSVPIFPAVSVTLTVVRPTVSVVKTIHGKNGEYENISDIV